VVGFSLLIFNLYPMKVDGFSRLKWSVFRLTKTPVFEINFSAYWACFILVKTIDKNTDIILLERLGERDAKTCQVAYLKQPNYKTWECGIQFHPDPIPGIKKSPFRYQGDLSRSFWLITLIKHRLFLYRLPVLEIQQEHLWQTQVRNQHRCLSSPDTAEE
jgi:hypothetical protein